MVLVNRDNYVNKMEKVLKAKTKFENIKIGTRSEYFQDNREKNVKVYLKSLKSSGMYTYDFI